jgi:hypothetical protein
MTKKKIYIAGALLAVGALGFIIWKAKKIMSVQLPPNPKEK